MNTYTVRADVNSEKFGEGQLVAHLNEEEIVEYANLQDNKERLDYLKSHGAQFEANLEGLNEDDVTNYSVQQASSSQTTTNNGNPQTTRKMRLNINGQDTGWVDVTKENEEQYNQVMNQFNEMHRSFNERFNNLFNMRPSNFLGFGGPSFLDRPTDENSENKSEDNSENNDQ